MTESFQRGASRPPSTTIPGRAEGDVTAMPPTGMSAASPVTRHTILRWWICSLCPACKTRRKLAKTSFCKTCYFALTKPFRNGLYAKGVETFADNYFKAYEFLRQIGMTK